ncbi:Myo-inositol transporter 1A [Naganishia friedmannii]|uniref:Myo-inositol transporter 1A n=1 Tax=Naganishia friedmannii TaxID=89922 RepID=A0ACC2WDF9_9TREE|nr:Myo-inositol transporter 1A [Naganishia friedmannii]
MSQFDTKQVPMEVGIEKGASEFIEDAPAAKNSIQDNVLRDAELMAGESQEKVSVISASLVSIKDDLGHFLSDTEKEWVSAGTSVGALIGALAGGTLADRIGRKWVLAIGDVLFVIGAIIICSSFSVIQIITGRVVLGFGVGIAAAVAPLYIAELAPTRFRGGLVTVQSICITGGQFFSYCIGIPLTGRDGWRIQFAIGIVPAVVQGAAIHFLPESPRYDLLRGREVAARKTLDRIYGSMSERYIDLKMHALRETVEISARFQKEHSTLQTWKLVATTGRYRRPAITALGVGIFQQLCGFNTLMYYSATIFSMAGFNNPTATGLIVSGSNLFFTIVSMLLLDRVGKRRILLSTYPGMIAGLALAAVAFGKMTAHTGGKLITGEVYPAQWSNMMLGMMVVFIAFYATGSGNITWTCGELFPMELRGVGSAILAGGVWSANIVISATFLSIMNAIGAAGAFGLYAGICALGLVFIFFCYLEPSGLSLEEIQICYEHGFGIAKSREIRREHALARKQVLTDANEGSLQA